MAVPVNYAERAYLECASGTDEPDLIELRAGPNLKFADHRQGRRLRRRGWRAIARSRYRTVWVSFKFISIFDEP